MESGFGASTCTTVKHSFRKTSDTVFQKNITAPQLKIPDSSMGSLKEREASAWSHRLLGCYR